MPAASTASASVNRADLDFSPALITWELTRACDLGCANCPVHARPEPHPHELTPDQALQLLTQLDRFPRRPLLEITGGDPLIRPDLLPLLQTARDRGFHTTLTPAPSARLSPTYLALLRNAGLRRLCLPLDGPDPASHDALRGVTGQFLQILRILRNAHSHSLSLQVNTLLTRDNLHEIDTLADLVADLRVSVWNVNFFLPLHPEQTPLALTGDQYDLAFDRLWRHAQTQPYTLTTSEACHYRRFVLQHRTDPDRPTRELVDPPAALARIGLGVNDGRGVLHVTHTGQFFPSLFLAREAGRFPADSPVDVYQNSPLFRALRNPDGFHGKCARCEYRLACGGSRARAFLATGDPLAAQPDCAWVPAACTPA